MNEVQQEKAVYVADYLSTAANFATGGDVRACATS